MKQSKLGRLKTFSKNLIHQISKKKRKSKLRNLKRGKELKHNTRRMKVVSLKQRQWMLVTKAWIRGSQQNNKRLTYLEATLRREILQDSQKTSDKRKDLIGSNRSLKSWMKVVSIRRAMQTKRCRNSTMRQEWKKMDLGSLTTQLIRQWLRSTEYQKLSQQQSL